MCYFLTLESSILKCRLAPIITFFSYVKFCRLIDGHLQDFAGLVSYLRNFSQDDFLTAMSDFHVLIYIAHMEIFPLLVSQTYIVTFYTRPTDTILAVLT